MRLQHQQVIVFGGSSGIGLATAKRAIAEGAQVAIVGTTEEKLLAAQSNIGAQVRIHKCDIMKEESVAKVFDAFPVVHHVVNTVGGVGGAARLQGSLDALMEPIEKRLKGSVVIAKHAIPRMVPSGSVTFFSGAGKYKPFPGSATALAAAGAVEILAKALAKEAAPVRFNTVCPGLVDTPLLRGMFPVRPEDAIAAWTSSFPVPRAAYAEEVADAAVFLMTNKYVTGETLVIDGGWRLT
jgi:NAD(P)-dependent dehydrogenase (short-subunit alcohol dehydrogenase family)